MLPARPKITAPKPTEEQRAYAAQLRTLADQAAERARLDAAEAIRLGTQLEEERERNPDPVDLHNRVIEVNRWAQQAHDLAAGAERRAIEAEAPIRAYDAQIRARQRFDDRVEAALVKEAELHCDITPGATLKSTLAEFRERYEAGRMGLRFFQ